MGIKRTDQWMETDLNHPVRMCRRLSLSQDEGEAKKLYHYLQRFGMYRPGRMAGKIYNTLVEKAVWEKAVDIYEHYRKKWKGPDIPVYIFPKNRIIFEPDSDKSGVSFPDRMFLFLDDIKEEKELAALIVHEYHHVCRLNRLHKSIKDYTLLDSMVMEGLAEFTVKASYGTQYNATWTSLYSPEEISYYWKRYIKDYLHMKRTDSLHDRLLYGLGKYPNLLGYSCGYYLILQQQECAKWTIHDTFSLPAEELITSYDSLC
nr:DUF2268 domain-containing putative Zn-dependent protease [uncultured Bacillus sp.]